MGRETLLTSRDRRRRRSRQRRGTALIMVLIVAIGIIGMISVLFSLSRTNAISQSESNQRVDIQLLLRTAIVDAYEEIITKADASTDGIGNIGLESCIGNAAWTGTAAERRALGRDLTVVGGRTLGKYIACVETISGNERILHIAVAYPDFEKPIQSLGSALRFSQALGGKNAVTFSGPLQGSSNFEVGSPSTANLKSALLVIKDTEGVYPAMNINDDNFFNSKNFAEFIEMLSLTPANTAIQPTLFGNSFYGGVGVAIPTGSVSGALGGTPSWSGVNGSDFDTISRYTDKQIRLNEDTVTDAADEVLKWIQDIRDAGNTIDKNANGMNDYTTDRVWMGRYDPNDPAQTDLYVMHGTFGADDKALEVKCNITGKGVLLIADRNSMKWDGKGSFTPYRELNWEGDVIWVVSENGDDMELKDGFHMNITGNLFIITDPDETGVKPDIKLKSVNDNGALNDRTNRIFINGGSVVMIAADRSGGSSNEINFKMETTDSKDYGSEIIVAGLWVTLGDKVRMELKGASGDPNSSNPAGNHLPGENGVKYYDPVGGTLTHPNGMADFFLSGSMIVAIPETSSGGLAKWLWNENIYAVIEYDDAIYEQEFGELSARIPSLISWENKGYIEVSGATKIEEMVGLIAADMAGDGAFSQLGN